MEETTGQESQPRQPTQVPTGEMKPHRGGVVLALGIIGIVICFICGIVAWAMGSKDLKEMRDGLRDSAGEQMTKAGMICGIIGTILGVLGLIWWIIAMVVLGTGALGGLSCFS